MSQHPVVIDKSYLDGATTSDVRRLCASEALMPDTLFAELVTTNLESRRRCFAKFPPGLNPITLIPSVGALLRYEMARGAPCTPLVERRWDARFRFHEGLAEGTYRFSEVELQSVREIEREISERVVLYREASSVVESYFPEIRGFRPNASPGPIDEAMKSVANRRDRIRAIYRQIVSGVHDLLREGSGIRLSIFSSPDPDEIDEGWAWFRNLQAQLLAALEFVRKNGAASLASASEATEHDLLDADYVTTGALSGALASRDGNIQRFFRFLCPGGVLIS